MATVIMPPLSGPFEIEFLFAIYNNSGLREQFHTTTVSCK